MVARDIEDIVNRYLEAILAAGLKVDAAYVFGSYATGKATEWSDIDIALLLPEFRGAKFDQTIELRKIGLKIDPRIEPLVFQTSAFKTDDWVPIIHEIKTQGIKITPAA